MTTVQVDQPVQAVQADPYCCSREGYLKWRGNNKDLPGQPGQAAQTPDSEPSRGFFVECDHIQPGHPLDPLETAELIGSVPKNWTRTGWISSLRDRMKRTTCEIVLGMLRRELEAIRADPEANS